MLDWLIPTVSFVGGAGATWLLLRIRFERFEAMDTRREADWTAWRESVDEKLHALNGSLLERVARLDRDIGTHETGLRGATHELSNRVTEISMRMSLIERRQENQR